MGGKEKQPFYKRWWFILIAAVIVLGISNIINSNEQSTSDKPKTEQVSTKPKQEQKADKKNDESEEKVIELGEKITSADYTVKLQRVKVKDDILTIVFDWENQSDWDPAHFELLGYVQVEQNGEALEEISGDRKYKQIKRGMFDVYDLEYKLVDDSDVTIRVVSTNEYDGSEGKVTVAIK